MRATESSGVDVLVVGDDPLARAGLVAVLAGREDLVVLGNTDGGRAGDLIASQPGDVSIIWDYGDGSAFDSDLGAPIVALVEDDERARSALEAGAHAVLLRDGDADRLAAAARAVSLGLVVLDEQLAPAVLREPTPETIALPEELTPREDEVLGLLADGLSNRRIAKRLGISEHTAKFHVNSILTKLDARSRTDAVVRAMRAGLLHV